jgi:pimeloyl-ACP methyl ester carboxylesterase
MRIRSLLLSLAVTAGSLHAQRGSTYVIVHGAWGGAWDWRAVDSALTSRGHRVHRVTLTGLGERVHLASPSVGLSTHISDVVNTILFEQLRDVVLVGHSYGGMVVTGAADRATDRIKRVVYVDAFLPDSGESLAQLAGPGFANMMQSSGRDGMLIPGWVPADAPPPRDVPHPIKTMTDTLHLTNPASKALARYYILTMDPGATEDGFSPSARRAAGRRVPVDTLVADHTPERSAIAALVGLLHGAR